METVLDVKNLCVSRLSKVENIPILRDISFSIKKGSILGLCGESGSGKSMCAYSIMRLLPHKIKATSGSILYGGFDLQNISETKMQYFRGNKISMVFQDPMTSLNPLLTIGYQLLEVIRLHPGKFLNFSRENSKTHAIQMLELCGISDPGRRMKQYPHELSGGMRQRVMIAMALMTRPDLLIADEPTTALDATIQVQILDIIKQFRKQYGMSVLFISHDLGVLSHICDEICVMYAGRICESGATHDIFANPCHCYTKAFLRTIPSFIPGKRKPLLAIPGSVPMPGSITDGCPYAPRCEERTDLCCKVFPHYIKISNSSVNAFDHTVACHRFNQKI